LSRRLNRIGLANPSSAQPFQPVLPQKLPVPTVPPLSQKQPLPGVPLVPLLTQHVPAFGVPPCPPLHMAARQFEPVQGDPSGFTLQLHTLTAQQAGVATFIPFAATVSAHVFAVLACKRSLASKPDFVGVAPHRFGDSAHVTPPNSIAKPAMKTIIRTKRITLPLSLDFETRCRTC